MEAVKQGSATVGLKSDDYAVLVAFKRRPSELAAYQKKVLAIDDHLGVSFAGLTADAKSLARWMRTECLNSNYFLNTPLSVEMLATDLGNKMQLCIQGYNKRPYGVGMLMAGYDDNGAHIIQICPSANFYPCKAMAIGARSQSARTYLEKHLEEFPGSDLEALVLHGLRALRDTLPNEVDLNNKNVSLAVVGKDRKFEILEDEQVDPYLTAIEGEERRGGQPQPAEEEAAPADDGGADDDDQQPGNMETS